MKLVIFTIVLDGMPFIKWQHDCFQKLTCDWEWVIVHGAAMNNGSTRWCKAQEPRLSSDGTTEYLSEIIKGDEEITVIEGAKWESKDKMVNAALQNVHDRCVLMQIDVDEFYKPETIDKIVSLFESDSNLGAIKMRCRYFVGPKLICEGENCWSNNDYEWLRVWRFLPGATFVSHEPPVLSLVSGRTMDPYSASRQGLTFDHLAYVTESQVAYKESFYPYDGLLDQWRALQRNTTWPAKLSRFFPFVSGEMPTVRKI